MFIIEFSGDQFRGKDRIVPATLISDLTLDGFVWNASPIELTTLLRTIAHFHFNVTLVLFHSLRSHVAILISVPDTRLVVILFIRIIPSAHSDLNVLFRFLSRDLNHWPPTMGTLHRLVHLTLPATTSFTLLSLELVADLNVYISARIVCSLANPKRLPLYLTDRTEIGGESRRHLIVLLGVAGDVWLI